MDKKLSKSVEKNLNRAGRKPGVPNKATTEAREAVKALIDANLPYLQTWLYNTAEGLKDDETGKYIILPNPGKACDIVQNLVEYAVPKLARTEVVGDEKAPQRMVVSWKK
jgi:hypothetical protein